MLHGWRSLATRCRLIVACALAMGCGQLQSADLQHGAVAGRIPNAAPGAYAYVLGAPEILAPAAADGSFRLDQVPAGAATVVLFDGASGAEGLPVTVDGASISRIEPNRPLRTAAALMAALNPLDGTRPVGLAFSVAGTPLRNVTAASGAALLFPLPAGTFALTATQPGFEDRSVTVVLAEGGSSSLDVALSVNTRDDRRGCVSCGCDHGLSCDPDDGRCYECVKDADCGPGGTCTPSHVCSHPAGEGLMCDACTSAADCGMSSAACVNPTGGSFTGYCTTTCSGTQACPTGYDCSGNACVVTSSCLGYVATYGATCTDDKTCQDALKDGKCFPTNRANGQAGYCTGRVQAGCLPGYVPDPQGTGYCVRLP